MIRSIVFLKNTTRLTCYIPNSFTSKSRLKSIPIYSINKYMSNYCDNKNRELTYQTKQLTLSQNFKLQNVFHKVKSGIEPYYQLMRIDKPIGSWLLYWPCAWSIALSASAGELPDIKMLTVFGLGAFLIRGAGCTINDMWDRDIDAKVERTKNRPLVTGKVSMLDAWVFLSAQLGASCFVLLQLNWYSIVLGTMSLGLIVVYPLMKRFTYWPQFVLGLTFNWGALMGWSAVNGELLLEACLPLYISGVFWTLIYDTIYAHQDKKDDLIVGIKSTALKFGSNTKQWLTAFMLPMSGGLITSGLVCDLGLPYYAALSLVFTHIGHQIYTLNIDNPTDCANKFISNHQVGFLIFIAIILGTFMKKTKDSKKDSGNLMALALLDNKVITA